MNQENLNGDYIWLKKKFLNENCLIVLFLEDGGIWDIGSSDENESTSILDVSENNFVICSKSSFLKSPVLAAMYELSIMFSPAEKPVWNTLTREAIEDKESIICKTTSGIRLNRWYCLAVRQRDWLLCFSCDINRFKLCAFYFSWFY